MRTKTIILSGVLAALTSASVMAQVYSLNAVGYINVTLPAQQFAMISDQLYYGGQGVANTLSPMLDSQLLTATGAGITFYKFAAGSYTVLSVNAQGTGYSSSATAQSMTLNPGEGIFVYNPSATAFTLTLVGTVPQGNLTNTAAKASGFSMISSLVPQAGTLDTNATTGLNFTPNNFDLVYLFAAGSYSTYTANYNTGQLGYSSDPGPRPSVAVGQSFFYYTTNSTGLNWTRTFNISQ
jgi:hypothetical protein